ncbi:ParM/StbA family protein [Bacillus sp. OTU530]|uniref:ParM/StbA family protein n=1 Tax=Bacillus sp. OTU530 TaxID=3043862 RepID=UPI00313B15E4
MRRAGVDPGNKNTKIATDEGVFFFDSCLGDGRDLRLENDYHDPMSGTYEGKPFFAGMLAEKESYYPRRSMGLSKAHEDMKLRVLIALHRFTQEQTFELIVGQPIKRHTPDEKKRIKELLIGEHDLLLNGVQKTLRIQSVEVAAEGAGVFWCQPQGGKIRIIEIGSGTVNIATIEDGYFIDKESDTLPFGTLSHGGDIAAVTSGILSAMTRMCAYADDIRIAGGAAAQIYPSIVQVYPKAQLLRPIHTGKMVHPMFANAIGFYELSKLVYGDA